MTSIVTEQQIFLVVMGTHDVTFPPASVVFECEVFSLKSNYTVQLRMVVFDNDVIIKKSDVIQVDWSSEYEIILADVNLPCVGTTYDCLFCDTEF